MTPSLMFMRDDEMYNVNVGVFFLAPSWTDNDFFAMQLFKRIMGEYRVDKYCSADLPSPDS